MRLVLNLTTVCNLACSYCFCGHDLPPRTMTEETVREGLAFGCERAREAGHRRINVTFFGGEPTLCPELIRFAVAHARTLDAFEFGFALDTNGTLLDAAFLDFCEAERIRIYLSLDGDEATNDAHRPRHDGRGSYDRIAPHIERLVGMGARIEKVIPVGTVGQTHDAMLHLIALGFRHILLMPDFSDAWTRAAFDVLAEQYRLLAATWKAYHERGDPVYISQIEGKIRLHREGRSLQRSTCACGVDTFSVAASGEVYPCTRFVAGPGGPSFRMGDVRNGLDARASAPLREFYDRERPECAGCTIRDRCAAHGCGCTSVFTTGGLHDVDPLVCEHERMVTRIADEVGAQVFGTAAAR